MIKKIRCNKCDKYRRVGNVKVVMVEPVNDGFRKWDYGDDR